MMNVRPGGMKPQAITLLTDFGTRDGYVAQMKGVILGIAPGCTIVDITHEVPPQDIATAAMRLRGAAPCFPPHSVHVAVVDPGVGTDRGIVAAEIGQQRFVAPDNGLLSCLLQDFELQRVVRVENKDYWLPSISSTFHGRDIMAPVAAHWSNGVSIAEFGPPATELTKLTLAESSVGPNLAIGSVLDVDRFGNVILNLTRDALGELNARDEFVLDAEGQSHVVRRVRTYAEAQPGTLVLLNGSQGWLELAISQGSAADVLQIKIGAKIALHG